MTVSGGRTVQDVTTSLRKVGFWARVERAAMDYTLVSRKEMGWITEQKDLRLWEDSKDVNVGALQKMMEDMRQH